jgi:hypothetical protein
MSETNDEGLGPSRCYAADVKGCIRAIESIYPSIGKAMYDEPRDRLAFKVNLFIQAILAEDRQAAQKQLKRLKPNRDRCHFCLGWIEKGKQHVCGYK